jgi:trehalose 6-phosphate phosphatase
MVELKDAGVSLHYRARPELALACHEAVHRAAARHEGVEVIEGKRVYEVRPAGINKGRCVGAFMEEEPFAGRRPIFVGDDVPDEDAFRVVNARNGIAVKVGDGTTAAGYTIASPASLAAWFERMLDARAIGKPARPV